MGYTFYNYHISLKDLSSDEIMSSIDEYMKKRGYVKSKADEDAEISIKACKSDKWFSYAVPGDGADSETFSEIGDKLYKYLCSDGKIGLSVECVDSDFAVLQLHSQNHEQASIAIGEMYDKSMRENGKLDEWQEIISEPERFLEIVNDEYVFVEDRLDDMGKLLGMNEGQILLLENSEEDYKYIQLNYKIKKQEKIKSFKSMFKEIFGEGLKEDGFVAIKGRQPYIVRMIGDEIFHVITYENVWCPEAYHEETKGWKAFRILASVGTVYRKRIDFDINPKKNREWLFTIQEFYDSTDPPIYSEKVSRNLYQCAYNPNDTEDIVKKLEMFLLATKEVIVRYMNTVDSLLSCFETYERFDSNAAHFPIYDEETNSLIQTYDYGDGLVCIKITDDGMDPYGSGIRLANRLKSEFASSEQFVSVATKSCKEYVAKEHCMIERVMRDSSLMKRAQEMMLERKKDNLDRLKKYVGGASNGRSRY